jgi:ATP-dependent DNA ligase
LREKRFVLHGEIDVPDGKEFSFDALLQRIHPAASRVKKLSEQTPALSLTFDHLKKGKTELTDQLLSTRRSRLEGFARLHFLSENLFRLSPASLKLKDAERWLASEATTSSRTAGYSIPRRQSRRYPEDKVLSER